jgi:hypothetical protein
MSTPARELRSMSSFDPSEPAILHDCNSGKVETWTGENEADFRKNSVARPDGTVAWRDFVFDGWGHVLGG